MCVNVPIERPANQKLMQPVAGNVANLSLHVFELVYIRWQVLGLAEASGRQPVRFNLIKDASEVSLAPSCAF